MHINFRSFQFAFFKHFDMAHIEECGQFEWNSNIHPEKATKRWFLSQFFFNRNKNQMYIWFTNSAHIQIESVFEKMLIDIQSSPLIYRPIFGHTNIYFSEFFLLVFLYVVIENLKHCKICVFSFVNKNFRSKMQWNQGAKRTEYLAKKGIRRKKRNFFKWILRWINL